MSFKTIAITGTKGKTTVSYLVDELLRALHKNTLRVDTTGHFLNGERRSTLQQSKDIWGLVPTVCPGRYLYELTSYSPEQRENYVAILESALGCSNSYGTGVKTYDVGVWTNVMKDHLGSTPRLQSQTDIANAKDFIFKQISEDGFAVFNACDKLVCAKTKYINPAATKLPCIHDPSNVHFDLARHLDAGGEAFLLRGTQIFKQTATGETLIYDAVDLPWTFRGEFQPALINLMYVIATAYAIYHGELPTEFHQALDQLRMDPYGGRLTVLKAKNGATIIADYAHEKESLVAIGALARKIATEQHGHTIGVVRLAYDRTDELINETGQAIGQAYDRLVVYDKIDGYWRKPQPPRNNSRFVQKVGRISSLLGAAIKQTNPNVDIIIREDEALDFTAGIAGSNDVVIFIVNDDIKRSVDWVREKFSADFA